MAQKMELNEMSFLISGGGRIDENKPIILQDHVVPAFVEKGAVEIKSIAPKAITVPDEKEIVAAMEEIRNTPSNAA